MGIKTFAVFLDLLTLALLFFPVASGIHKGMIRRVLSIVVLIVSAGVGYFGSQALTPSVYDEFLRDQVHNVCLQKAEQYDPVRMSSDLLAQYGVELSEQQIRNMIMRSTDAVQYAETLADEVDIDQEKLSEFTAELSGQLLSSAPETVQAAVPEVINSFSGSKVSTAETFELIRAAAESPEAAAVYAEDHYAKPLIMSILRIAIFAVITLLVRVIAGLIIAFALSAGGAGLSATDRILGGLIGVVQAALEVGVLVFIIHTAETVSSGRFDPQKLTSFIFLPIYSFFFN